MVQQKVHIFDTITDIWILTNIITWFSNLPNIITGLQKKFKKIKTKPEVSLNDTIFKHA